MTDRRSPYLLQPDVLLPQQFHGRHRRHAVAEQNLMFAVLQDAVDHYKKHAFALDFRGRRLFRETCEWITSRDRAPFSFQHICEVLDLNPSYIRRGLERWREAEGERRAHAGERLDGTNS